MSLPSDAPRPRRCHVIKSSPSQEYGFDLHAEKVRGQFIGNVDANSPASESGLQRGDRIIAVNGVSIQQENHKDVVKRIKEDPMQCRLVVLDEDGYAWYNERKLDAPIDGDHVIDGRQKQQEPSHHHQPPPIIAVVAEPPSYNETLEEIERQEENDDSLHRHRRSEESESIPLPSIAQEVVEKTNHHAVEEDMIHHRAMPHFDVSNNDDSLAYKPRPRLCKLKKTEPGDEYGFNLHAERGKGHFIGKVDPDSIAERAGLEEGQRIVGVNNTLIYPDSVHKDVVTLIKQSSKQTELLVAYPEIDQWYRNNKTEFSFEDAETVQFDEPSVYKPHHPVALNGNLVHETHVAPVAVKVDEPHNTRIYHGNTRPPTEWGRKETEELPMFRGAKPPMAPIPTAALAEEAPHNTRIYHGNTRPPTEWGRKETEELPMFRGAKPPMAPIPTAALAEEAEEPVFGTTMDDTRHSSNVQTSYEEVNEETHHHVREEENKFVAQERVAVVPQPVRHSEPVSQPESTSTRPPHSNGAAPDLFNMSASEMRERLSSRKKNDPRKDNRQDLTLKQKYDIIQNL